MADDLDSVESISQTHALECDSQQEVSSPFLESIGSAMDEKPMSDRYAFSSSTQTIIDKLTRARGDPTNASYSGVDSLDLTGSLCLDNLPTAPTACSLADKDPPSHAEISKPRTEYERAEDKGEAYGAKDTKTPISKAQEDLVNFQFERLVSDRKRSSNTNTSQLSTVDPNIPIGFDTKAVLKTPRNVQEIIMEYLPEASNERSFNRTSSSTTSCKSIRPFGHNSRTGLMNRSQNNETLDSCTSDTDQLRRHGSSVDADIGDFKKSFHAKTSYSNLGLTRSKTSISSLGHNTHVEDKIQPLRHVTDSDVDVKPTPGSSRVDIHEMRTDLPGMSQSFQKERERLRHIETLITKTPMSTYSNGNDYQSWKTIVPFKSKFLLDMNTDSIGTSRKALSSTDYSKYSSEWRSSSSERSIDQLYKSQSSPNYRTLNQFPPTHSSVVRRDFSPGPYESGVDGGLSSSMYSNDQGHYTFSSGLSPRSPKDVPSSQFKTNKWYDTKKNKNMSKAVAEAAPSVKKSNSGKARKSKSSALDPRANKQRSSEKSCQDYNSSRHVTNKNHSKVNGSHSNVQLQTPSKESNKESWKQSQACKKYVPYQPLTQAPLLQQRSLVDMFCKDHPKRSHSMHQTMSTVYSPGESLTRGRQAVQWNDSAIGSRSNEANRFDQQVPKTAANKLAKKGNKRKEDKCNKPETRRANKPSNAWSDSSRYAPLSNQETISPGSTTEFFCHQQEPPPRHIMSVGKPKAKPKKQTSAVSKKGKVSQRI